MKKLFLSLSVLAVVLGFNACSTDVDLYADYKDTPIIYGLLDASVDTNYIRINRAFSGSNENHIDATEVALIEDSCNYPGKMLTATPISRLATRFGLIPSPLTTRRRAFSIHRDRRSILPMNLFR